MHNADIYMRLNNKGAFAAMELAGLRGDLEGFKDALQSSYGPVAERVYHKTIDAHYDFILKQAEALMDAETTEEEASLVFWATLAENHEKRGEQWS